MSKLEENREKAMRGLTDEVQRLEAENAKLRAVADAARKARDGNRWTVGGLADLASVLAALEEKRGSLTNKSGEEDHAEYCGCNDCFRRLAMRRGGI